MNSGHSIRLTLLDFAWIDTQSLHPIVQRAAFHSQSQRGAVRSADATSGLAQDADNALLLFKFADNFGGV